MLFSTLLISVRYGLVVRIPGSHPGGPGSIPGIGIILIMSYNNKKHFETFLLFPVKLLKLFKIINLKEIFTNSTTLGWFAYKQTSHMASEELLIQIMMDSLMDSLKME